MAALVTALVGTAATVVAAVMAVLQFRRSAAVRHRSRDSGGRDAIRLVAVSESGDIPVLGGSRSEGEPRELPGPVGRGPEPVVLLPPTGRLGEVRGREEILEALGQFLTKPDGKFHVLAGLGGVGKTTVALALADRARGAGRAAWWVSAMDRVSLADALLSLALELGAPPAEVELARTGSKSPAQVVWAQLEASDGWLLVLDNADSIEELRLPGSEPRDGTGWLRPTQRGLLLVTSRVTDSSAWGWHAQVHAIGCLDDDAAAQVLAGLAPRAGNVEEAVLLARRLGGLPLALHQAGSSLGSSFTAERSFAAYRSAVDERFPGDLDSGDNERALVTRTWELSLDALASAGQGLARPVLRVLSCFAPSVAIPTALLDMTVLAEVDQGRTETDARSGLSALLSVGLIETRHEPGPPTHPSIVIHPLVADASRLHLTAEVTLIAARLIETATGRLELDQPSDWPRWQSLLPHIRSLLALPPAVVDNSALIAIAHGAERISHGLNWGGAHTTAGELAQAALDRAKTLGTEHEAVLGLRFQCANSDRYLGRYARAAADLRDIAACQSRVLGPDDPRTLSTQIELARAIANLGRYAESEDAFRKLLAAAERVLGPDNLDTLAVRDYLARATGELGHYATAAATYTELISTSERVFGPAHPFTLIVRHNLSAQMNNQGRHTEAEKALKTLIDDWATIIDRAYSYTFVLDVRYELGRAIAGQARYSEARHYLQELVADEYRIRGHQHPHALLVQRELATAITSDGDPALAESMLRQVRDAQTSILGPDHPRTLITIGRLAASIKAQGRLGEALALYRHVHDQQARILGIDHPDTLAASKELARQP